MRLLVIGPHFPPDVAPTGEVLGGIVGGITDAGHRVDVVTSLPWYLRNRVEPEWSGRLARTETVDWGKITRLHPFPTDKRNVPARALAFGAFTIEASVAALRGPRPDGVLVMSPPLSLAEAGWVAARRWRVPFVFNVQDIFPDVAIAVGSLTNERIIRVARTVERQCYRRADAVTVLSQELAANVTAKLEASGAGHGTEVRVIPNFVDCEAIRPGPRDNGYRRELGLGDETVVMYAGNIGFSQSVELLVEAARRMTDRDDVVFVVNGGGSGRAELERRAEGLPNVRFVGYQPAERLPEVLAAADLHVVPLRRGLGSSSVPSKLYSILAAGRPVLASIDPGTEVSRVLETAGAGVSVAPDDQGAFDRALGEMLADRETLAEQGRSGRTFVEKWLTPTAAAAAYVELFQEMQARRRGER